MAPRSDEMASEEPSFLEDPTIPWAIDMDGTLIREDVTEVARDISFASPRHWLTCIVAHILYFSRWFRVTAYRILERFVPVDPSKLTYHQSLLRYIRLHRCNGGIAILATASHIHVARNVVKHVERMMTTKIESTDAKNQSSPFLFDDVIGSHPPQVWDASGHVKAKLIHKRFPDGFVYAGNSSEDISVWNHSSCRAMILVNCPPEVLKQAKRINKPYIILD
uniref:Uncharacterized protein n=1 Tax=Amphora coffeiformis TaxID=265554 RepID=A0A7S3P456_9STRA